VGDGSIAWRRRRFGGGPGISRCRSEVSPAAEPVRRFEGRRRPTVEAVGGENRRLKEIVADKELEIEARREIARVNCRILGEYRSTPRRTSAEPDPD